MNVRDLLGKIADEVYGKSPDKPEAVVVSPEIRRELERYCLTSRFSIPITDQTIFGVRLEVDGKLGENEWQVRR